MRSRINSSQYETTDIVVVDAMRSIIGAINGSLGKLSPAELGAGTVSALLERLEKRFPQFHRSFVRQIILGNCVGAGIGQNLPRQLTEKIGMAPPESAFAINELCGSGLEAILLACQSLLLNEYPIVLAGGIECPSASPYLLRKEQVLAWQDKTLEEIEPYLTNAAEYDALWCATHDVHTIVHAEQTTNNWVSRHGIVPEKAKREIDEFAVSSNEKALKAIETNAFDDETAKFPFAFSHDELPKRKEIERLTKRKGTQYTPNGQFLTSHNSPQTANCAAFLVLTTGRVAREMELEPLARIFDFARAGVQAEDFLLAPIVAIKTLLKKTGTTLDDYAVLEFNPAFGSQMLFYQHELQPNMDRLNPLGDCIALGHPVGAAGARILTTLLHTLKREEQRLGMAAICLGGGNAIALAVERIKP